jgi:DNA-binding response OmpR family regulator
MEMGRMAGKPRLLIVEDEEHLRNVFRRWFELRGFEVDWAEDGAVAVEKFREGHYDVVTMDLEMPRMNGTQAIAAIKSLRPDIAIIVVTGHSDDVEGALAAGAACIFGKPTDLRELEAEVRKLVPPAS